MYTSKIIFKGTKSELPLSESDANDVQRIFKDPMVADNYLITKNRTTFRKGDIRMVSVGRDNQKVEIPIKYWEDEDVKMRRELEKLSPEMKGVRLGFFLCFYRAMTGGKPDLQTIEEVKKAQTLFFKSNPKRSTCDMRILSKFIPKIIQENKIHKLSTGAPMLNILSASQLNDIRFSQTVDNSLGDN